MKRIALILAIVMLFTFVATGCGEIRGVEIDYGTSEMYTKDDMQDAISSIFAEFTFVYDGKLETLTYAGDEICKEEFLNEYQRQEHHHSDFVSTVFKPEEIMVFYSDIKLTKYDKNDEMYYKDKKITWVIGKVAGTTWECIDRKNTK